MPFEFGACPFCRGDYEFRSVEVRMKARGRSEEGHDIVLSDIPQGVCRTCDSRVYKAEVLARIEAVMMGASVDPILANG